MRHAIYNIGKHNSVINAGLINALEEAVHLLYINPVFLSEEKFTSLICAHFHNLSEPKLGNIHKLFQGS
jgi:hypothetical protein